MDPLGTDLHKESQPQEAIRRKPETHDLRIICPTASRFQIKFA